MILQSRGARGDFVSDNAKGGDDICKEDRRGPTRKRVTAGSPEFDEGNRTVIP